MRKRSTLELQFWAQVDTAGLPAANEEYPVCGHKADFAWPTYKVLAELQGATWSRGRHTRGRGYAEDRMLSNWRQLDGWIALEFTSDHLNDDHAIPIVSAALRQRGWNG